MVEIKEPGSSPCLSACRSNTAATHTNEIQHSVGLTMLYESQLQNGVRRLCDSPSTSELSMANQCNSDSSNHSVDTLPSTADSNYIIDENSNEMERARDNNNISSHLANLLQQENRGSHSEEMQESSEAINTTDHLYSKGYSGDPDMLSWYCLGSC